MADNSFYRVVGSARIVFEKKKNKQKRQNKHTQHIFHCIKNVHPSWLPNDNRIWIRGDRCCCVGSCSSCTVTAHGSYEFAQKFFCSTSIRGHGAHKVKKKNFVRTLFSHFYHQQQHRRILVSYLFGNWSETDSLGA